MTATTSTSSRRGPGVKPVRVEFEIRNMPASLIMSIVEEAGARRSGERTASAEGWTARLVEMPPAQLGPLRIPRDMLVIEGDEQTIPHISDFMRRNLIRGGG